MQLKCHVPLADRVVPESRQSRYHGVRAVTLAARARLCLQPRPSAASGPQVLGARGRVSRDPRVRSPGWALRPQATGPKGRGRRCSLCAWSGPVLEGGQAAGRGGLGPPGSSPRRSGSLRVCTCFTGRQVV